MGLNQARRHSRHAVFRLARWAWDTDHDDRIPTVIAGCVLALLLLILAGGYGSLWLAFTVISLPAMSLLLAQRDERNPNQIAEGAEREIGNSRARRRPLETGRQD